MAFEIIKKKFTIKQKATNFIHCKLLKKQHQIKIKVFHGKTLISDKCESFNCKIENSLNGDKKNRSLGVKKLLPEVNIIDIVLKNKRIFRYDNHNVNLKIEIEYSNEFVIGNIRGKLSIKKSKAKIDLIINEG